MAKIDQINFQDWYWWMQTISVGPCKINQLVLWPFFVKMDEGGGIIFFPFHHLFDVEDNFSNQFKKSPKITSLASRHGQVIFSLMLLSNTLTYLAEKTVVKFYWLYNSQSIWRYLWQFMTSLIHNVWRHWLNWVSCSWGSTKCKCSQL